MALTEAELYACYQRLEETLYNVAYRWLWQPQDCEDILHDAFLRVWDRRAHVDAATVDNLVWTTVLNLARNRLRWRRLWQFARVDDQAHDDASPQEDAARRQREERLRHALDQLPTAQREVLLLAEIGGLNTREIAEILAIPPGTVGSRKHAALARLRQILGDANV